jgi:hypothetical protein
MNIETKNLTLWNPISQRSYYSNCFESYYSVAA